MFHLKPVPNKNTPTSLGRPFLDHHFTTDNNYNLQMWEFNHDFGKYPVLFIHGWASTADSFFPLLRLKLHTHSSMLQDKKLAIDLQKFLSKYSKKPELH